MKQVIVVNEALKLPRGKLAAQVVTPLSPRSSKRQPMHGDGG